MAPVAACADVFEIADDGSVIVRSGNETVQLSSTSGGTEEFSDVSSEALTLMGVTTAPPAYAEVINRVAARYNVSPALLEALVWQESRWRQSAVSPVGAVGLTQLMPGTARAMGVDPRDPVANIEGGARYLREQLDRFDGDVEKALAAYNAGPARVIKAGGIPPIAETHNYVSAIFGRLALRPAPATFTSYMKGD
jgi:hypothetical protein